LNAPLDWRPAKPFEIIGPGTRIASKLIEKANRTKANGQTPIKILLYGPPCVGKTTIAELLAAELTASQWSIEETNGKLVTIETVKGWMRELAFGNLFSDWSVKIVNELDRQSMLCEQRCCASRREEPFSSRWSLSISNHPERNEKRSFSVPRLALVEAPASEEIRGFLMERWEVPESVASMISVGCGGNVRAALADLETYLDAR
jgi:replication-associated recombination protein RarA